MENGTKIELLLMIRRTNSDILEKIMLYLNYEVIREICYEYQELEDIYHNQYFWKNKILRDFKEENIDNVEPSKMRCKYLILLGTKIDEEVANYRALQSDSEYVNMEKEYVKNVMLWDLHNKKLKENKLYFIYEEEIKRLKPKLDKIRTYYRNRDKQLLERASKYFKEGYGGLPVTYDKRLIYINLNYGELGRFLGTVRKNPKTYDTSEDIDQENTDEDKLLIYLAQHNSSPSKLGPGNLLVYVDKEMEHSHVIALSFIDEKRGKLAISTLKFSEVRERISNNLEGKYPIKELINIAKITKDREEN